jgi:cephalosporin-C deacetylase-like acetyl esterase
MLRVVRGALGVMVLLMWLLCGGVVPAGAGAVEEVGGGPGVSAAEVEAFYWYDPEEPLSPVVVSVGRTQWYDEYEVTYESLGETVYSHFMLPVSSVASPAPCLVGLHGMFSRTEHQFRTMGDFCAKRGIAVLMPSMPFHHRRTKGLPLIPGQQLIVGRPEAVQVNLRRAVLDVRRAVDWLSTVPGVDAARVSVSGASLGGVVAALAFKVDPRLARGVFVGAASGVAGILESGDIDLLDVFRAAARAGLVDPEAFVEALQIVDPINVPDAWPRPALLINGWSDAIMVKENAMRLKESLGMAEQLWTTGGHYVPLYAAEYLIVDYLLGGEEVRVEATGGFAFTERVRGVEAGTDNLWVDISAELGLGSAGTVAEHELSVPMVNRTVPMVVMSEDTYRALAGTIEGRHLPAFVYVVDEDSCVEFVAALAYAQVLGMQADPQVYYVAPVNGVSGGGEGGDQGSDHQGGRYAGYAEYAAGTLRPFGVNQATNTIESLMKVPGALGATGAGRMAVPLSIFDELHMFGGAGAEDEVGKWLLENIAVENLEPIPWFPDYPCDNPRWL